jgi:hypothetical protein
MDCFLLRQGFGGQVASLAMTALIPTVQSANLGATDCYPAFLRALLLARVTGKESRIWPASMLQKAVA